MTERPVQHHEGLEFLLETVRPDDRVASSLRATFYQLSPEQQDECHRHLLAEYMAGGRAGTLRDVLRIYARTIQVCNLLACLDEPHMKVVRAKTSHVSLGRRRRTFPYVNRKIRRRELAILARLRARHFRDDGEDDTNAMKRAEALVLPPAGEQWPPNGTATAATREPRRLSRIQRLQLQQALPHIFGGSPYLLALVEFLVILLIENGGRWEGLQYVKIRHIIAKGSGAARTPILICVPKGPRNKLRIYWRTKESARALMTLLSRHPRAADSEAILLANPFSHDPGAICDIDTMTSIWGAVSRHLKLDWTVGPRAFRVYNITTHRLGASKAHLRMGIGHVPHSDATHRYVRYDKDDLIDIARKMGFTHGLGRKTCPACKLPVASHEICPHCRTPCQPQYGSDEQRIDAFARLGLDLHRKGVRTP